MRTPPRPPRRHDRQRLLIRDPVPIPIHPGGEPMGTGQMDPETGEPLPTLMTQDPLGGAVQQVNVGQGEAGAVKAVRVYGKAVVLAGNFYFAGFFGLIIIIILLPSSFGS